MSSHHDDNDDPTSEGGVALPAWDPLEILQRRSDSSSAEADDALRQLREGTTDEQILDEFGINLSQFGD